MGADTENAKPPRVSAPGARPKGKEPDGRDEGYPKARSTGLRGEVRNLEPDSCGKADESVPRVRRVRGVLVGHGEGGGVHGLPGDRQAVKATGPGSFGVPALSFAVA
jgi:hypothetical protein